MFDLLSANPLVSSDDFFTYMLTNNPDSDHGLPWLRRYASDEYCSYPKFELIS